MSDQQNFRVDTCRRKTGSRISNIIPGGVGRELLQLQEKGSTYFFWNGMSKTKSITSVYDKLYREVFAAAGVAGGSHRLRHLFAVSLLERGVDIRLVSKALGHKSVAITERYYGHWSKKQQTTLAAALTKTWT